MQNQASLPPDQFEALPGRLPAGLDLDNLARRTEIPIGDRYLARGTSLHRFREQSANQADFIVPVG